MELAGQHLRVGGGEGADVVLTDIGEGLARLESPLEEWGRTVPIRRDRQGDVGPIAGPEHPAQSGSAGADDGQLPAVEK